MLVFVCRANHMTPQLIKNPFTESIKPGEIWKVFLTFYHYTCSILVNSDYNYITQIFKANCIALIYL